MAASNTQTSLPRTATGSTVASGTQPSKTPIEAKTPAPAGAQKSGAGGPPGGHVAPLEVSRPRFIAIFLSLMVSIFLFALDQLIVATAIPKITVEFNSLTQLPWLASGFFLTLLGFALIYSQLLQIFPSKLVMLLAVFIFEIGSLVCGVAPSMEVLILGRAIAGWGAAGIFGGAMVVIAELTTLSERPKYFAFFGVCFAIASIIGPLVGGAFADHVSWRWCFYINLPFGGIAMAMLAVFQPLAPPLGQAATYKGLSRDMVWRVLKCDWVGVALSMGWGCSVILALQWGGVTRPWNDGGVITCLVLAVVLPAIFVAWEYWLGDQAMFRLALLKSRTIAGASIVLFFLFGLFMFEVYYISLVLQAVYRNSATMAGVKLLPMILTQIVVLIGSSRVIPKLGRFKWVIVAGPCFLMLGCGLLYTVKYGVPENHILGFQALLGIGIGLAMQNSMLAVQFDLRATPRLISAGTGLATFLGFAGRIVGISLAGAVFENMLQVNLHKFVPDLSEQLVLAVVNSADAVYAIIPEQYRDATLFAYTEAMRDVYIMGVPFAAVALFGALMIRNSKMPTKADEDEQNRQAREKAKADAAGAGVPAADAEKAEAGLEERNRQVSVADREAGEAEALASVAPIPQAALQAEPNTSAERVARS